jgi:signal transduction histidine kinase
MAKLGQSSFRRMLLSRLLLLSIPVLLTGELVTYHKARSSLLETVRQNLTESAVQKGENIRDRIESMRANLVTASEALSLQLDNLQPDRAQDFVTRMVRGLPTGVQCVQLTNLRTQQVVASSCGARGIALPVAGADTPGSGFADPRTRVRVAPVMPSDPAWQGGVPSAKLRQLDLIFSTSIYDGAGRLRYDLSVQSAVHRQATNQRGSLTGSTVVIDQDGMILAHPREDKIGLNIKQEKDAAKLQKVLTKAIAGDQDFLSLSSFGDGGEWLVGYSSIEVNTTPTTRRSWTVLAASPLDKALYGLEEVKQVLVILILGLVLVNVVVALYLARDLAVPIERLSDYAQRIYRRQVGVDSDGAIAVDSLSPMDNHAPKNFKIKEIDHLAEALDSMVESLQERAEELEAAWQEAQVANQLKSEFLATTSHELRTPLNAIIGCVRLVRDGCCDDREEELDFLLQADDAAIHLLKIINDLLDIAKIEAGRVELNLQPLAIQDLCDQCLRMVMSRAEKKHISLSVDVAAHLHQVPLDERRVHQMVINLLSNAVKFTPENGSIRLGGRIGYGYELLRDIRPDRSPVNADATYLCLEVRDTGIGIPKERWHLLFRPFQQIDSSHTRQHEGTGLGLALTKRLAELHGGTVSFQSQPGTGSTFRIWLPLRVEDLKVEVPQEVFQGITFSP